MAKHCGNFWSNSSSPRYRLVGIGIWDTTGFYISGFAVCGLIYSYSFLREYYFLLFFQFLHGVALGVFVPATLMVIFKNIPVSWWVFCLALYALRVPFTSNAGVYLLGVYSNTIGWEWIYWQDVFFAPLIALFACIGTNSEKVDHELLRSADWGGMILFGSGLFLIYIGLDQGIG
ncbi:hypothetical protein P4052_31770 [Pseudomonas aeruginosa]|nr:hypothetical protein [Pseudomonas aeruginosa]